MWTSSFSVGLYSMNKLKILALVVCTLFCSEITDAQNVVYSAYEKFDFRSGDFSVVGNIKGRLYAYRGSTEGFFLDAYDDSMQKTATVVLDFFPQKIYQANFIAYTDHIIVLYQAIESNRVVQYAALLDETGRLKKGPIQLDEAKTGIFGANKTYFSYAYSEDKKNIVVYSAGGKNGELVFNGKWIDDELNVINRSHAVFKTDNDLEAKDAILSNEGYVYLPVHTPVGSKNYSDQAWLLCLQPGTTKFVAKELPLNNMYAAGLYMKMDNVNKRVYAGGFYSSKKNGSFEGILYAFYDITSASFQNKKFLAFDPQLLGARSERNKKRAFDDYVVRQIIVKNDGGFVMVSESYFVSTRYSYAPGFGYYSSYYNPYMTSNVREYHYNDIMVLSYNAEGTREWGTLIPKTQYSQEDAGLFSSYALLNTGGTLAFLFNDFNSSHSRIQMAAVDAQGKTDLRSFTAEGNDYPDWLPRSAKQIASRAMIVPCLHKRQICFAKIVF